jgi:hypothetical protein
MPRRRTANHPGCTNTQLRTTNPIPHFLEADYQFQTLRTALHDRVQPVKYTNRQLRKETKGLEVRYNALLFLEQNDVAAPSPVRESASIIQCPRFLHHCHPHRIRKIVMKSDHPAPIAFDINNFLYGPNWSETFLKSPINPYNFISAFCNENPKALVEFFDPEIHDENFVTLFCQGLTTKAMLQRPNCLELCGPKYEEFYLDVAIDVGQGKEYNLAIGRCGNCNVYPHDDGFDERWFREQVEEDEDSMGDVLPRVPGGIDTWVKEVYRWYREGL